VKSGTSRRLRFADDSSVFLDLELSGALTPNREGSLWYFDWPLA
jgi:hypothetical protein